MTTITHDTLPEALAEALRRLERIEKKLDKPSPAPVPPEPKWLSIDELIEYLPDHPAKQTVYGWVADGIIPVYRGRKRLRFLRSEIDNWLMKGRAHSPRATING